MFSNSPLKLTSWLPGSPVIVAAKDTTLTCEDGLYVNSSPPARDSVEVAEVKVYDVADEVSVEVVAEVASVELT